MSKIIKLRKDVAVQTAPSLDTEGFLSFEDFWQADPAAREVARRRSPKEAAMEEATGIVRQAADQAESIRQEAWARGEEEGRAAGLARYEKQLAELAALFAALEGQRAALLLQNEEEMFALITTMVDRLVEHEVSTGPQVVQACLKKAMEFVVENSSVQVHLNPDELTRLKEMERGNPTLLPGNNRVMLVEDAGVAPGGCLLKTDFGEIDATLETRKARLYEAVFQAFTAANDGYN